MPGSRTYTTAVHLPNFQLEQNIGAKNDMELLNKGRDFVEAVRLDSLPGYQAY
jgi:hypothetical protein